MISANPIVANNLPLTSRPAGIAPEQLRAARSMLDWTRSELAKEAKLSAETIKNIEHGTYMPKEETINTLVETFARRGIQFVQHEATASIPAEGTQESVIVVVSHASVVRTMVSVFKTKEEGHG